jgi:hypothetical protein
MRAVQRDGDTLSAVSLVAEIEVIDDRLRLQADGQQHAEAPCGARSAPVSRISSHVPVDQGEPRSPWPLDIAGVLAEDSKDTEFSALRLAQYARRYISPSAGVDLCLCS